MEKITFLNFAFMTSFPPWLRWVSMCMTLLVGQVVFAQVNLYSFTTTQGIYQSIASEGILVDGSEATITITNDTNGWSVDLPFTFSFNFEDYTSIYVNSNGGATFGTTTSNGTNLIFSSSAYLGAISVMDRNLWGLFITSGVTTSGSNVITNVGSFRGIAIGKELQSLNGIPSGASVIAFDEGDGTITMSAPATSSSTSAIVRYGTGKVFTKVEGAAPNRVFTIQWEGFNDYSIVANGSNYMSFQLKLTESSNTIQIVYGDYYNVSTTAKTSQLGLRGATNTDYTNRTGTVTTSWNNTSAGTSNSATVSRNHTNFPASGLTFTWTPPSCPPPSILAATNIGSNSADLTWAGIGSNFDIEWGALGFARGSGTTVSGVSPYTLSGLSPSTSYSYYVRQNCGGVDFSNWVGPYSFATTQVVPTLPYNEDFSTNQFAFVNGNQPNKWAYGSAAGNPANAIYVSNDGGATNTYTITSASTVQAYRDIAIPSGGTVAEFGFDWKGTGENSFDYARVWLVPTTFKPTAGSQITAGSGRVQLGGNFNMQSSWQTYFNTNLNVSSFAGQTMRLVFEWRNDGSRGTQSPIAIDNIIFEIPTCFAPVALSASNITSNSAELFWTSNGSLFDIKYGVGVFNPISGGTLVSAVPNPYILGGLTSHTTYNYYVRQDCGSGDFGTWAGPYSFTTLQTPATLPYIDDFSTNQFSFVNGTQTNKWVYGAAAGNPANAIYISNDGGATNAYTINSASVVQAYRDIAIPSGTTVAEFGFDWKGDGESGWDYTRVWLVPVSFMPTAGTQITAGSGGVPIGTFLNLQSTWQTYYNPTLNVSSFAGQTVRLVFEWKNDTSGGVQSPTAIDNIVFQSPACSAPVALSASNITSNSAELSWTSAGSLFDIKYGVGVFDPVTGGTSVSSVTNPYILGGLNSNTSYSYYVRLDCGSETSIWGGPYSFITSESLATLPYIEDFSTNQFSFVNGIQANKWAYGAAAGNPANAIYISNNSGATNAYTVTSASIVHAYIDIAIPLGESFAEFGFDWKGAGEACCDYFRVWLAPTSFLPTAGYEIYAWVGRVQIGTNFSMESTWQTYFNSSLNVSSFAGQTMRLVFEWRNNTFRGSQTPTAIDNIVFKIPECSAPLALSASNITWNSAELSWTGDGSLFDIKYGAGDFDPTTGGTSVSSVTNPYTLGGISPSTSYTYYVRQDCGSRTSSWAGPYSFTTTCGAAGVPYLQDFESAIIPALPNCTSNQNLGAGNNWVTASGAGNGFTGNYLRYSWSTTNPANTWFYTQGVELEAGVTYSASYDYGSAGYDESMKVAVGTSALNTAMTTLLADHPLVDGPSQNHTVYFTPSSNGVYYFGFHAYSAADQFYLYLDNILIREAGEPCTGTPNAGTATASASSGESPSNVDFAVTGHDTSTEGLSYDWEYSTDSGITWLSTESSDTQETFTITGPVGTVFQIRYAVKCSFSGLTGYSNIVTFTVTQPDTYCTPTYTDTDDRVSAVRTTGADSNINYTNAVGGQHFDRTDLIIGTTPGQQFTLNTSYVGGSQTIGIWIDWGKNNTFDDLGDRVAINYSTTASKTFTITIPSNATPGDYRLRVRGSWDNHVADGDAFACNAKYFGSSIDFTLQVGTVISGYVYDNGWLAPMGDPSGVSTDSDDIKIVNGTTALTEPTEVNNLTIEAGATLNITSVLNLFGDMAIDGDLVFISNANGNGELGFVGGTIRGEATIQSYMSSNRSYRMVSSAVSTSTSIYDNWQEGGVDTNTGFGTHITGSLTGANGFDATATGNPSMFTADPNLQMFVAIGNTNVNTLTAGDAYLLFVRGDRSINLGDNTSEGSTTLRAKGMLRSGSYEVSQATGPAGSFAMIGNPYQSAVDINSAFAHSDNVNPKHYYVYDPHKGTNGGYVTVNLPDGNNLDGSTANQFLQPGQAAQFATLTMGSSSVFFEESNKAPGNFSTTSATGNRLSSDHMLTVQLYTSENFSNDGSVHDSFGIIFGDGLDNEVTHADALKPMNFYENLARNHNGTLLSIERREMPIAAEVYPLYSSGYNYEAYILKMRVDGLDETILYLYDHFTGTSTLIDGSETIYTFSVNAEDGLSIATDRFSIRTEARLGVDNNGLLAGVSLFPNPLNDNTFYINAPKLNGEQISVSISDVSGRQIFEKKLDCRANTVTVSVDADLGSGVYMVTLGHGGEERTYKLLKK